MPAVSTPYRIMYRLEFKPWDNGRIPAPLVEVVEGTEPLPKGRALDLGCGTGTHSVYLARHGWSVTGVETVSRALAEAARRAAAAAVDPTFVAGDIRRLTDFITGDDYSLILDVACFHGLAGEQRQKTAGEITKVAKPGAIFLLFGFQPGKRGFLPHGINRDEVIRLFGSRWELLWEREVDEAPCLRGPLKTARPTGFCLRKG